MSKLYLIIPIILASVVFAGSTKIGTDWIINNNVLNTDALRENFEYLYSEINKVPRSDPVLYPVDIAKIVSSNSYRNLGHNWDVAYLSTDFGFGNITDGFIYKKPDGVYHILISDRYGLSGLPSHTLNTDLMNSPQCLNNWWFGDRVVLCFKQEGQDVLIHNLMQQISLWSFSMEFFKFLYKNP